MIQFSQILKEGKTTIVPRKLDESDKELIVLIQSTEKQQKTIEELKQITEEELNRIINI